MEDSDNTIKKIVPVLNMSCAACASSSQNVLLHQEGVTSVSVNYASGMATIEYNPNKTNLDKLKAALQEVGYDLMLDSESNIQDKLEEIHKDKIKTLTIKTIVAIVFSVLVVAIAMIPSLMHMPYADYIMWALATPVVFYSGWQFFRGAYKQATHRMANMDTLVALSSGVAYLFSVFNTLYPSFWTDWGMEAHVYFEAAAVVISFVLLGKLLEERAKGSTSASIKKLIGLQPKSVTIISNGQQKEISIDEIKIGDIVIVKPGEKIAVDGVVTSGASFVDESMISGEPVAIEKKAGKAVFAGTINQKGSFQFKAEKVGSETLLSQIIQMVQDAQGSKAPVQKLVDKIAGIFVPIVIVIAIITLVIWTIFGGNNGITQGLLSMITVLVIACPCALGLATPTAIIVGMGKGAENGILIKDAESLELAKKIDTVVLDKTGTITEGKPSVTDIKWIEEEPDSDMKNILYSIEKLSEHPLADAVCSYLKNDAVFIDGIKIESISGRGITGIYNGKNYFIGNLQLASDQGIDNIPSKLKTWINDKLNGANTVVLFGCEQQLISLIAIRDKVKRSSILAVQQLTRDNIEVYMLTGDNEQTAQAVACTTGIMHYKAGILPQDKLDFIKELQAQGRSVAMVGDGINDSAALAQADVSIAMGKGSDIAMDVAKMTIISNDLTKIPQSIRLSKETVKTIKQNLFWAFIYNVIGIPIAVGILYPFTGFLLNPMIAGAAMALSSISVVTNSLRLKFVKLNK